jgi:hypothetical protein
MTFQKLLIGMGVSMVLLAGCESLTTPEEQQLSDQDLAVLKQMILSDPLYTIDPVMLNDGGQPSFDVSELGKTATPIIPIAWGRNITNVNREIAFTQVNDTTLIATLTHTLEGTVFIVAKYSAQDTGRTIIRKPFTEVTVRKIKFYKTASTTARADSAHKGWRPAEVSAVKGGTTNANLTITRLDLTVGNTTTTITDPTEYFMKLFQDGRGGRPFLPTIGPRQTIKVRVTLISADADTDWVAIHRPGMMMGTRPDMVRPLQERMKLISQTQVGTNYQRVFEAEWTSNIAGMHTFFVSALTRSSLHDDQARFSSQIWGVPYIAQ